MVMNQLEVNLEAITNTLAILKKENCKDKEKIKNLEEEREKLLKELKVMS
ncbi:MAG: hypothetical protein Q4Q23_02890 [Methanobacteriaceae archaeon]|nr:hypothetical protein [Methanobacteriaceae archaeon]